MADTDTKKVIAIFGYPVSHSLSPVMHNAGFNALGLDYVYVPFRVKPSDLKDAGNALKALNFKGANITVPHKEAVMDYLDEISEDAFLIGAVNTIVNADGKLVGDNTDSKGFIRALKEAGMKDLGKSKAVVLGAGGASKAACIGLLREGVKKLVIANRTVRKAELLLENFKEPFRKTNISISPIDCELLEDTLKDCDLLVNTTSVGMDNDCLDVPLDTLKKGALVYDIIYNPPKTKLLKKAEKLGYKIENGLNMLLYQGVEGFEIWTKEKAPVPVMRKALFNAAKM